MAPQLFSRTPRLLALSAALFLVAPTSGQEEVVSEVLTVTAIEIPVQVFRRKQPIRGLSEEQFEVLDNGKPVPIASFEVIDLLAPATATTEIGPGAPSPASSSSRGRHILLLFDFDFSSRAYLARGVESARKMIDGQLDPRDRAAVSIYTSNGGGQLLAGFSSDESLLHTQLDAVDAALDSDVAGIQAAMSEVGYLVAGDETAGAFSPREIFRFASMVGVSNPLTPATSTSETAAVQGGGPAGGIGPDEVEIDPVLQQLVEASDPRVGGLLSRVREQALGIAELATFLRELPDPKTIIFFSDGLPNLLFENRELQGLTLSRIQPLIDAGRAAGWSIHSIDVEGIRSSARASTLESIGEPPNVTGGTTTIGAFPADSGPGIVPSTDGFNDEGLELVSRATGGELHENFNKMHKATQRVLDSTAVTYLLTIQPEDLREDGRFHELEVRVAGLPSKARVVHRPGYMAPKPLDRKTALELGLERAESALIEDPEKESNSGG